MRDFSEGAAAVIAEAEAEGEAALAWRRQRERDGRSICAIEIIQALRTKHVQAVNRTALDRDAWNALLRESDAIIRAKLAEYGLTWEDCDFQST